MLWIHTAITVSYVALVFYPFVYLSADYYVQATRSQSVFAFEAVLVQKTIYLIVKAYPHLHLISNPHLNFLNVPGNNGPTGAIVFLVGVISLLPTRKFHQ